jgi:hypothetical protein
MRVIVQLSRLIAHARAKPNQIRLFEKGLAESASFREEVFQELLSYEGDEHGFEKAMLGGAWNKAFNIIALQAMRDTKEIMIMRKLGLVFDGSDE